MSTPEKTKVFEEKLKRRVLEGEKALFIKDIVALCSQLDDKKACHDEKARKTGFYLLCTTMTVSIPITLAAGAVWGPFYGAYHLYKALKEEKAPLYAKASIPFVGLICGAIGGPFYATYKTFVNTEKLGQKLYQVKNTKKSIQDACEILQKIDQKLSLIRGMNRQLTLLAQTSIAPEPKKPAHKNKHQIPQLRRLFNPSNCKRPLALIFLAMIWSFVGIFKRFAH